MLVLFSDASKAAYDAAAYVVWTLSDTPNEARLVLANRRKDCTEVTDFYSEIRIVLRNTSRRSSQKTLV